MSSPTAAAPVAVLVLAWDETAPAVRALVEAAEGAAAVDSMVVVVPAGAGAPEGLTQEEFLPLPELPPSPPSAAPTPAPKQADAPRPAATLAGAVRRPTPAPTPSGPARAAAASAGLPQAAALPAYPPLAWEVVRVLRLSSFSLPALAERTGRALPAPVRRGGADVPAAPYAGGSIEAAGAAGSQPAFNQLAAQSASEAAYRRRLPASSARLLSGELAGPAPRPAPAVFDALPPCYPPIEPLSPGADLDQPELFLPAAGELAGEAQGWHSGLEELLPAGFAPAQASWPDALASLRQPAAELDAAPAASASHGQAAAAADTETAAPTHPALRPATGNFTAPNLNFQVIQYARFAVPVALAEQPFAVLYAPAWPTWLAAQELRQRTGQPLVLHVAALAAADEESVETATGWVAELQRQALRRADLILTETPALAYRLRQELSLPMAAVRAVPAADAAAIAHALHTARVRSPAGLS